METKVKKIEAGQYEVTVNGHEWHVRRIAKRKWEADGDDASMIWPTMEKAVKWIEEFEAFNTEDDKQVKEETPMAEQESDGFVVGARVVDSEGDEGVIIATDWPHYPTQVLVMYDRWVGSCCASSFMDDYKDMRWSLVEGNEKKSCVAVPRDMLKIIPPAPAAQPPAPTFTRDDLKTGMIVELDTGDKYMVIRNNEDMTLADGTQTKLALMGANDYKDGELIGFDKGADVRAVKVYAGILGAIPWLLHTAGHDIVWEYKEPPTDWAHFPMDGLVIAIGTGMPPQKRHFAGLNEDGRPTAWSDGKTSFTANGERSEWADMKPYKGNEHLVGDK